MSHCSVVVWHPAQPRAATGPESHAPRGGRRAAASRSGELVEKEIHSGNPAVPGNDEIRPGVRWRLPRAAFSPLDPPAIAHFLGPGDGLIAKVRVRRLDRARDAIDRVAPAVDAPTRVVEHAIFGEELVDGRAPTRGGVFPEDVVQIAGQQGRYAGGHGWSPFGILPAAALHRILRAPGASCSLLDDQLRFQRDASRHVCNSTTVRRDTV